MIIVGSNDSSNNSNTVLIIQAKHQFDKIFEDVYNGQGLDGVPWVAAKQNSGHYYYYYYYYYFYY